MLNYKKKIGKSTGQNFDMCMGQESLDLTTKQQSIKFFKNDKLDFKIKIFCPAKQPIIASKDKIPNV